MMTDHRPADLLSLPHSILTDALFPLLDVQSLVRLGAVSHALQSAVDDELVWRRRINADFKFPLSNSARITGWRSLYRGLSNPELYTWGSLDNNRIGIAFPQSHDERSSNGLPVSVPVWNVICRYGGVPFPLSIPWQDATFFDSRAKVVQSSPFQFERPRHFNFNANIPYKLIQPNGNKADHGIEAGVPVELHAGGWSFLALTHLGNILAWGSCFPTLTGSFRTPTLLDLNGERAASLSVGRAHSVAEVGKDQIFEFVYRWDRHAVHSIASIVDVDSASSVRQVEAGWDFTAVLVDHGEKQRTSSVWVWSTSWTFEILSEQWHRRAYDEDAQGSTALIEPSWQIDTPKVLLPSLPEPVQRIAAGDKFVIALTESGAVYFIKLPNLSVEDNDDADVARAQAEQMRTKLRRDHVEWQLLQTFGNDSWYEGGWNKDRTENIWDEERIAHLAKSKAKVTHISAQFASFAVYAPNAGKGGEGSGSGDNLGVVLLGEKDAPFSPIVMPELQGIGVIKVAHGDWHSGALTADGKVLTWGGQSSGALGTWDSFDAPEEALSLMDSGSQTKVRATGAFSRLLRMRGAPVQPERADGADQARADGQSADYDYMVEAERRRFLMKRLPDRHNEPRTVRFGFPKVGETRKGKAIERTDDMETKSAFDIAFAGWHSGALAIDRIMTDA